MTPRPHPAITLAGAAFALALGLVAPAFGGDDSLQVTRRTLRTEGGTTLQVESGELRVPERRSVAGSRRIPIRFLRLKSTAAKPRAPLFFLAGGPGDRAVSESPGTLEFWSRFLGVSDVVLVDQRGVTDPALRWQWDGPPPLAFFTNADSARAHALGLQRRAAAVIRARGVDLAGYTTAESAADLDALRSALGMERVSLLAFSYGTHLACAYLRAYGEHVDDVVMLGLEGPDQTLKLPWTMDTQFAKVAQLAARDPEIARQVPDLVALYDRVVARLVREPAVIPVRSPDGRDTLRVPVGPFGLQLFLRADIGDATDLVVFPRLLWDIDRGDLTTLAWFLNKRAGIALHVSGMNACMDEASGATRGRLALIGQQSATSRFADVVNFPPTEPGVWPVPDLGDGFRAPLVTMARTLLISGSLDFNTPPFQSEEFRWGAPNATHLVVENAGHEQTFFQNDEALPVVLDFLAGRDVTGRRISYPPLRFVPLQGRRAGVSHPSVER